MSTTQFNVLKQKYTILIHILPISLNADKDEYQANIDKIVRVWFSLVKSVRSSYHKTKKRNHTRMYNITVSISFFCMKNGPIFLEVLHEFLGVELKLLDGALIIVTLYHFTITRLPTEVPTCVLVLFMCVIGNNSYYIL